MSRSSVYFVILLYLKVALGVPNFSISQKSSSLSIHWKAANSELSYSELFVQLSSAAGKFLNATTFPTAEVYSDGKRTFPNLEVSTQYYVLVLGFNDNDNSSQVLFNGTTFTTPNRPQFLKSIVGTNSVILIWTVEGNKKADYYQISYSKGTKLVLRNETKSEAHLSGLKPGRSYNFTVHGVKYGFSSERDTLFVTIPPLKPNITKFQPKDANVLRLEWSGDIENVDEKYEVKLGKPERELTLMKGCTRSPCDLNVSLILPDFDNQPGSGYKVSIIAYVGLNPRVKSEVVTQSTNSRPIAVNNVSIEHQTVDSITIQWREPSGMFDGFKVEVSPDHGLQEGPSNNQGVWTYIRSGLKSGHLYKFGVITQSTKSNSDKYSVYALTKPQPPVRLQLRAVTEYSLLAEWDAPIEQGNFEVYIVDLAVLNPINSTEKNQTSSPVPSGKPEVEFRDLVPGQRYLVSVFTVASNKRISNSTIRSNPISAEFNTRPRMAIEPSLSVFTNKIVVTWKAPEAIPSNVYDKFVVAINEINDNPVSISKGSTLNAAFGNLQPGSPYTIIIKTVSGSQESQPVILKKYTKPNEPLNLRVKDQDTNSLTVAWDPPSSVSNSNPGFDRYKLEITKITGSSDKTDMNFAGVNDKSYKFEGLEVSEQYLVRLASVSHDEVNFASPLAVSTRPAAPAGVNASAEQPNSLTVSWYKPTIGVVSHFIVRIYDSSSEESLLTYENVSSKLFVNDSKIDAGRMYIIRVFAVSNGVESKPASVNATTMPLSPFNLTSPSQSQDTIDVQWVAPSRDTTQIDSYLLLVLDDASNIIQTLPIKPIGTSYKITNLSAGIKYVVRLHVVRNQVRSEPISLDISTLPSGVASVDLSRQDEDASHILVVRWSKPESETFSFFEIKIDPNDGREILPIKIQKGAQLGKVFKNLLPGRKYTIQVYTVAEQGTSHLTSRSAYTAPLKVLDVKAQTLDSSSIKVSWRTNPSSTQDEFEISYLSQNAPGTGNSKLVFGNQSDYKIEGLRGGHVYSINVTAVSGGVGGEPNSVEQTTKPDAVRNLTAVSQDQGSARLHWKVNEHSKQDGFRVQYVGRPYHTLKKTVPGDGKLLDSTSYLVRNLFAGITYTFTVISMRMNASDSADVMLTMPPHRPINVTTETIHLHSFVLTWRMPGGANSNESYYDAWNITFTEYGKANWTVKENTDNPKVFRHDFQNLSPGQKYQIVLHALSGTVSSKAASFIAVTKPRFEGSLRMVNGSATNDSVVLEIVDNKTRHFDKFKLVMNTFPPIYISKQNSSRKVLFSELLAGHSYRVRASVLSGDQESDFSNRGSLDVSTLPNKPHISLTSSNFSITISIGRPSGGLDSYHVRHCLPGQCGADNPPWESMDPLLSTEVYSILALDPNTNYQVQVKSVANGSESAIVTDEIKTNEAAPDVPFDGKIKSASSSNDGLYNLAWHAPNQTNGIIRNYKVTVEGTSYLLKGKFHRFVNSSATPSLQTLLKFGYNYTIQIQAVTVQPGSSLELTQTTPTEHPRLSQSYTPWLENPEKLLHDKFTVVVRNPFDESLVDVTGYTLIISEEASEHRNKMENLGGWAYRKKYRKKEYIALPICRSFHKLGGPCSSSEGSRQRRDTHPTVDVLIGGDSCDESKANKMELCNGYLKSQTDYYVALRAYSGDQKYTDTHFSGPYRTKKSPTPSVVVIVIVVLVVLLGLLLLALLFFLVRTGRIGRIGAKDMRPANTINLRDSKRRWSGRWRNKLGHQDDSRPVKVSEFVAHVQQLSADTDFRFSEEYEDLKHIGREQSTHIAELPINRSKNRFTNILPYDNTRVKLLPTDDEDGTDYINASYVPGKHSKREFIVTQGPLPSTRDDFWRMVWEQNVRAIIMLTRCVEKGREKCDHYWPVDAEPMFYGDLQVVILNETKCSEWIVSEFKVSKGDHARKIVHFHYTAWPDFGVPERPQSLIRFVRLVRSRMNPDGGPLVVHCSAGVGRAGTFVCLDQALYRLQSKEPDIDIFSMVAKLRRHRPAMVQTEQQYICIHKCLLCILEGQDDDVPTYTGEENEAYDDDEGITIDHSA